MPLFLEVTANTRKDLRTCLQSWLECGFCPVVPPSHPPTHPLAPQLDFGYTYDLVRHLDGQPLQIMAKDVHSGK